MVWILTLSETHGKFVNAEIQTTSSKKEVEGERQCRANRPGEALVLGDVGDVEGLHGVFDVLGVHVVDLTDVVIPAETWSSFLFTGSRWSLQEQGPDPQHQVENIRCSGSLDS